MPFVALAGAGLSAASSIIGGIAASDADRYQAQIADRNAQVASMEGATTLQAGMNKATEVSLKNAQELGKIRTSQAASGVDVHGPSATSVYASQKLKGEMESATTAWDSEINAWGKAQKAIGFEMESKLDESKASGDMMKGILGGAGALFSGLTSMPGSGGFLGSASPVSSDATAASSPMTQDPSVYGIY